MGSFFYFILSFNFPFKNLHSGYSSFVTMAKVLYCIALLLFDWSSADTKRLDESELMRRCKQRDIAYVKEKVAEFGNKRGARKTTSKGTRNKRKMCARANGISQI